MARRGPPLAHRRPAQGDAPLHGADGDPRAHALRRRPRHVHVARVAQAAGLRRRAHQPRGLAVVPRGRGRRPLPRRAFRGVLFVFLSCFFYGAPGAASCPAGRPSPDPSAGPRGAPAHAAPPRWEPPACRPTGPRASRATCVADRELTSEPTRGPPTREVPPRRRRRAKNAGRHVVADRDGRDSDRADDGRGRGPAQARRGHDARRRLRARVAGRGDGRGDPGGHRRGGQGPAGAEAAVAVDGADLLGRPRAVREHVLQLRRLLPDGRRRAARRGRPLLDHGPRRRCGGGVGPQHRHGGGRVGARGASRGELLRRPFALPAARTVGPVFRSADAAATAVVARVPSLACCRGADEPTADPGEG